VRIQPVELSRRTILRSDGKVNAERVPPAEVRTGRSANGVTIFVEETVYKTRASDSSVARPYCDHPELKRLSLVAAMAFANFISVECSATRTRQ
jgi:hypothetical protein